MSQKVGSCAPKGSTVATKGTASTVYKVRLGDALVAVKEYVLPQIRGDEDEAVEVRAQATADFMAEAEAVLCVPDALPPHASIAAICGVERLPGTGGNLDRLLITQEWVECEASKGKSSVYPEDEVRVWMKCLVEAVAHLHAHDITHDDIRPKNVLLSTQWPRKTDRCSPWPVLTDHRVSKYLRKIVDPAVAATTMQQPSYCPPEIFSEGKEYDPVKCDIWGLGTVALEWLSGKKPWSELDPSGKGNIMFRVLQSRNPPAYPAGISANAKSFLDACFLRNADERPEAKTLLSHAWLS